MINSLSRFFRETAKYENRTLGGVRGALAGIRVNLRCNTFIVNP